MDFNQLYYKLFLGQPVFDSSYLILDTFTFTSFHCYFVASAGEEGEQVAGQGRGGGKEVGKPPGLFFSLFLGDAQVLFVHCS